MKKSPLTTVLLAVLAISTLASVVLCYMFVTGAGEFRRLQEQNAMINNNRGLINALANEALEYSKQHSDIDPILVAAGVKPGARPALAPTQAPGSTKPATK
ncbi:MAG TPA: hypothetical protein VNT26_24135 [Candidatus Sulfotelmatobacter sp.]|nr:hypothetical protein [Candidatus Sulfotelmatobacter sp.]HWI59001.1 hypothetical protein [Bacillota bacterium]